MKINFKKYLVFLLCASLSITYSQKNSKIDSLKKLGRNELIKLAVKKLNEPAFVPDNYDRIIVKANSTSLIVGFSLSIRLSDNKSCFYDAVYVSLEGNGGGKSVQGSCDNPSFFKPSKAHKEKLDFIFTQINKKNEIGDIPGNKLEEGNTMEITEHANYYSVEVSSWSTFSHYKIDKVTGKISDSGHKHYARNPDEKDEFEIIK